MADTPQHIDERHLPGAEVTYRPHYHFLPTVEVAILHRRFPGLRKEQGKLDVHDETPANIAAAMDAADFFLHGSGPVTIAWRECDIFRRRTGRQERNAAMKEHDHSPLREAIKSIVREIGMRVLIGHEDEIELQIGIEWTRTVYRAMCTRGLSGGIRSGRWTRR